MMPWDQMRDKSPAPPPKGTYMVVLPEQIIRNRAPDPAAETEVLKQFLASGLALLDEATLAQARRDAEVLELAKGPLSPARCQSIQKKYRADFLVVGEGFAEVESVQGGMQAATARVELKAIHLQCASIVASEAVTTAARGATPLATGKQALQNAGRLVAPRILTQLGRNHTCPNRPTDPAQGPITLLLSGLSSVQDAARMINAVRRVSGVERVEDRGFENGQLEAMVTTSMGELALASAIVDSPRVKEVLAKRRIVTDVAKDRVIRLRVAP